MRTWSLGFWWHATDEDALRTGADQRHDVVCIQAQRGRAGAGRLVPGLAPELRHVSVAVLARQERRRQRGARVRRERVGRRADQLAQLQPRQQPRGAVACAERVFQGLEL